MTRKQKDAQPIVALDPVAFQELKKIEQAQEGDAEAEIEVRRNNFVLESLLKHMGAEGRELQRMAFEVDPDKNYSGFASLYRAKTCLTPDHIIKRITGPQGDDLVCQILQARANHIASFGRPRASRFTMGFDFQDMEGGSQNKDPEIYQAESEAQREARMILWNCGYPGLDEDFHPNLSQFLKMITRDGLSYGRFAVENIYAPDPESGEETIHSFRAVDAGTIYRIMPHNELDQSTRAKALQILERIKNKKFEIEKYKEDEYRWVQVIEGRPMQAFTDKELTVYNLYPVTNVEYNGYPLTPIDQSLHAITTHINITIHNKLYFQNGRAARGMLLFKSDTLDEQTLHKVRLQFHQSINSVQNSWRMPVFGVGTNDDVRWESIDVAGRDAEFQYLMDNNARVILSAFQMSPEELPGYQHLSRGTNTQALAESNNEWKLTAARDVGLRPLLLDIQDFLNAHIMPKFFPKLSKTHQLALVGLEKDSPEKEATRLSQDMGLHMTYDEVMEYVEKEQVGREMGGRIPLNPEFQATISAYFSVGEILENFMGRKGAATDPRFNYYRDPWWFQWQQILMQKAQMSMQQQMMMMQQQQQQQMMMAQQQQQAMEGGEVGGDGGGEGGGESGESGMEKIELPPELEPIPNGATTELKKSILARNRQKLADYNKSVLEKTAQKINQNRDKITQMILRRQDEVVESHMKNWKNDSKKALKEAKAILGDDD